MAISFPASPSNGDIYTYNGAKYVYDGVKWVSGGQNNYIVQGEDATLGSVQMASLNSGPLAGMRNQIINGDFRVWQRGTSIDVNPGVAEFTADRWRVSSGAGSQAVSRQISTLPGFAYEANFNTALGSIFQGVELDRLGSAEPFVAGSTWTFSCWVRYQDISALNFAARFNASTVGDGTDSTPVVSTPFGPAVETAANSWSKHVVTFTIPDPLAFNGNPSSFEVILPGGAAAGGLIRFTGVQLEPGPVATPFEHRPIGTELALCQRYYYVYSNSGLSDMPVARSPYSGGYGTAPNTSLVMSLAHPVRMRANPTAGNLQGSPSAPNRVTSNGILWSARWTSNPGAATNVVYPTFASFDAEL